MSSIALAHYVIPIPIQYEIRREAADSAVARQGEATTYRIELEMELEPISIWPVLRSLQPESRVWTGSSK